jgi:hypothetical protein
MTDVQNIKVKDARGREIEVKKLKALDRLKLFEIIGPDNSMNGLYLNFAVMAYSVVSIDGTPIQRITAKSVLEATVQLLEDDGFAVISKTVRENFMPTEESVEADRVAAKN